MPVNTPKDNLFIGTDARDRIVSGIRKCAAAVGGTMGTGGHNAILEVMENPGHMTTNDGITMLEHIRFADPLEEMGRKILLEPVKRANKQSGDGSSTATVLTAAIIEEGIKALTDNSPMDVKRSLEECMEVIEESLYDQTRHVEAWEVGQVATISAEDPYIGNLIQEIYQQIGKDGIIHWDISKTFDDHYTIGTGITMHGAGYASPYMADLDEKTGQFSSEARLVAPKILITRQKITSAKDFGALFETLNSKNIKEIVVFCEEFEANVVPDLIRTRAVRGFKTVLVKMPIVWGDEWFEDLAQATGATIIDPDAGVSFKDMTIEHLGTVGHIVVAKDDVYLDGIKDLTEHISSITYGDEQIVSDAAKLRASRLNTHTARYYVGAASDSALSYRRLKVEDAISAAYQALQGGIVAGGGLALLNVAMELGHETIGRTILVRALAKPMNTILANAGIELKQDDPILKRGGTKAWDSKSRELVDMFEAGIVDPAPVVLNAVRNAISVAASVIASPVIITMPDQPVMYAPPQQYGH